MTVNKALGDAVAPLGYKITEREHTGGGKASGSAYFTFRVTTSPSGHADDEPTFLRQLVSLYFHAPHGFDCTPVKVRTANRLFAAGFGWPSIVDLDEPSGPVVLFECEYAEGVPDFGKI